MNCIIKSDLFGDSFEEKLAKIDQIRLAREPFDIVTSLGTYESMFFDGAISISRETSNNTVLAFTATFSHLDFINTETTTVDLIDSGKDAINQRTNAPAVDVGKKQLQDEVESSTLFDIASGVFG